MKNLHQTKPNQTLKTQMANSENLLLITSIISLMMMQSLTTFVCGIYYYARFKVWKYGRKTTAKVLKCWSRTPRNQSKKYGNGKSRATHYMTFSFRHDQTKLYLPLLVEKYTTISAKKYSKIVLPKEIINLCIQFIGYESITISYGSYEITREYQTGTYYTIGDDEVEIKYDTTNPHNVDFIVDENRRCSVLLLAGWMVISGFVGLQSHWIITGYEFPAMSVLSLLFGIVSFILLIPPTVSIWNKYNLRCCCKKNPELQIEWQSEAESIPV